LASLEQSLCITKPRRKRCLASGNPVLKDFGPFAQCKAGTTMKKPEKSLRRFVDQRRRIS
jgi:hypothetical protein